MISEAPGKLFVIGEYAVLTGAPAVLVPVPQRARVEMASSDLPEVVICADRQSKHDMQSALQQLPLLRSVAETLAAADRLNRSSLTLDTSAFFREGRKLGLGSSAALTAALVRALLTDADETTLERQAIACHRRFQQGRGSGADVALAIAGRPVRFMTNAPTQAISLPESLHMLAVWTGDPASTTDFVSRFDAWRGAQGAAAQRLIEELHSICLAFIEACSTGNSSASIGAVDDYDQVLMTLSSASGLDFYSKPHQQLRNKVKSADCVYKPSGAGGGDFGLALSTDITSIQALSESLTAAGWYNFLLNADQSWSSHG